MYEVFRIRIGSIWIRIQIRIGIQIQGFWWQKKITDKKEIFFKILQFLSLGLQDLQATG
jgi:hypothetical protein